MSEQSKTLPDWRLHLIRVAKCEEFQADSRLAQAAMLHIETTEKELADARAALREGTKVVTELASIRTGTHFKVASGKWLDSAYAILAKQG